MMQNMMQDTMDRLPRKSYEPRIVSPFYDDYSVRRIISNIYNQNNQRNDWNEKLQHLAGLYDVDVHLLELTFAAFIRHDKLSLLKVSEEVLQHLSKAYQQVFPIIQGKIPGDGEYFNFTSLTLVHYLGSTPAPKKRVNQNLVAVTLNLQNIWITHSDEDNFEPLARAFNKAASQLSTFFHSRLPYPIPLAIEPQPRMKEPRTAYKVGFNYCPMLGDDLIDEDAPSWMQDLDFLLNHQIPGVPPISLEDVKREYTPLYSQMVDFLRSNLIVIHDTCKWPNTEEGRQYLLNTLTARIAYHTIVTDKDLDLQPVIIGKANRRSKHSVLKIGNVYTKCLCIVGSGKDKKECGACINLSDPTTLTDLKNVFDIMTMSEPNEVVKQEYRLKVNHLFEIIDKIINPLPTTHRVKSKCPECSHYNTNQEALRNHAGWNPLKKHPTDVQCESCGHEYCTDCHQTHPGHICRGFLPKDDPGKKFQACPMCSSTSERISGCTFIRCEQCATKWCWTCRCIRFEELAVGEKVHFCLVKGQYLSNPDWDNGDVQPYTHESPTLD